MYPEAFFCILLQEKSQGELAVFSWVLLLRGIIAKPLTLPIRSQPIQRFQQLCLPDCWLDLPSHIFPLFVYGLPTWQSYFFSCLFLFFLFFPPRQGFFMSLWLSWNSSESACLCLPCAVVEGLHRRSSFRFCLSALLWGFARCVVLSNVLMLVTQSASYSLLIVSLKKTMPIRQIWVFLLWGHCGV